ncbi:MAG TPA: FAD-binding protein [Vicinamibacterales bacterium]|nr:FAD-binding protein [Vicinamibacterales bacterium]
MLSPKERKILRTVADLESRKPGEPAGITAIAFTDCRRFVSAILAEYAVPESAFTDARATAGHAYPCGERETWSNYVGTQVSQPFRIACPTSVSELQDVIRAAARDGLPVRAVGSHHAWSDAAVTDGVVIETTRLLEDVRKVDPGALRDPAQAETLVTAPGGITIANLNEELDELGLALINMGGYAGQTLAGAISTSTHGSGLRLGAFPEFVAALVMVTSDGRIVQIETDPGITDPKRFKPGELGIQLVPNNNTFNAAVVGIGCLGVIISVTLRVKPKYRLEETRTIEKWSDLRERLLKGLPDASRHVEVWINPHARGGDHTCLLTLREETQKPPGGHRLFRNLFGEFLASLPGADRVLAWLFNSFPADAPELIDKALHTLEQKTPYIDRSDRILDVGASNGFAAVCSEFGVDVEEHVQAADAILALVADVERQGIFQSGPIALRYVARSPGFLSMQPRPTCMIELPMLRDVYGSSELLWRYEQLLTREFRARPHWGQLNFLTGSHEMLERLYGPDNLNNWLSVFRTLNERDAFRSRFTDRVGFTSHAPSPHP